MRRKAVLARKEIEAKFDTVDERAADAEQKLKEARIVIQVSWFTTPSPSRAARQAMAASPPPRPSDPGACQDMSATAALRDRLNQEQVDQLSDELDEKNAEIERLETKVILDLEREKVPLPTLPLHISLELGAAPS
jgi:hypothetical protein